MEQNPIKPRLPQEVQISINRVSDAKARVALEAYRDRILQRIFLNRENPHLPSLEIDRVNGRLQKARDQLQPYMSEPEVKNAYEMITVAKILFYLQRY